MPSNRYLLLWAVFGLFSLAGCTTPVPAIDHAAPAAGAQTEVRKSPNDDRQYRYLTLPNQLQVLLVSDPQTEKSAAALAVYRGSQNEPPERPGLAHFLEHMLFIQTHTYPEIDGFQTFVTANGGSSNAYTALDHTNYFFDIRPDAFNEALDRFAHFFIDPVLSPDYAAREKNAVHSEYQMQMKDDNWRGYMVSKQLLNPEHPASRFTIGSLQSLDGDIHEDLMTFFKTAYSADQMALVALTDQPLDAMEALIVPVLSQIDNSNIGPEHPEVPVYTSGQLPTLVEVRSEKQGATVEYSFPIPSTLPFYASKPEQYIANLIGHEGTGSLYQQLKQLGWIESLGASVGELDFHTSAFNIVISLTEAGRAQLPAITDLLFQYLTMLKANEPQRWLYDEQAVVAELGFRFQERSSATGFVYRTAPVMHKYPPRDLLVAPYLMEQFEPAKIRQLLELLTPENVIMQLSAHDIEGELTEPWFNVAYNVKQGPLDRQPYSGATLALPPPNPYLPTDLALKQADDHGLAKSIAKPGLELWLDTDAQFGTPRANLFLELAVEGGLESPRDRAISQLYRLLVEDGLAELVYPAYLAGLGYALDVPDAGFGVRIQGYHDKQAELLAPVLQALLHTPLQPEVFTRVKDSLIREWRNTAKERPFQQAFVALSDALRSGRHPRPDLVEALTDVSLEDLDDWRQQKLGALAVRGILHGNVARSDLERVAALLETTLPLKELSFHNASVRDVRGMLRLAIPVNHDDASMVLHVQDRDDSYSSRARSALAAQLLQSDYFEELRTHQQLGYVVSVTNRPVVNRGGISFIVQSPNTSAAGLERATLEFIDQFVSDFASFDPAEFEQHKAGLLARLLESPKNLAEKSERYWVDFSDNVLSFDSREQVAAQVERLSQQDMLAFFQRLQEKLARERLLIFTQGAFEDVPQQGRLLSKATDRW